ncbi:unnamed protein product, partial [Laminaria digitata]
MFFAGFLAKIDPQPKKATPKHVCFLEQKDPKNNNWLWRKKKKPKHFLRKTCCTSAQQTCYTPAARVAQIVISQIYVRQRNGAATPILIPWFTLPLDHIFIWRIFLIPNPDTLHIRTHKMGLVSTFTPITTSQRSPEVCAVPT